jgi:3'(2'), 5'-bisphosphate nucleotidase
MWMNNTHYSGNPALDGMLRDTALSFQRLLESLRALAGDASQNILDLYAKSGEVAVSQKSDASPVTDADHASHRLICESLTSLTPAIPVLSEESTLEQLIGRRDWPCCWMIDPLDGTREFLEGTGEFTVNIALIIDAEAVLGLIAAPNRGYLDLGVPGWGARRFPLFSDGPSETLATRPLDPHQPLVMCASARHREERVQMMLNKLSGLAEGAERSDSGSALKFCDLAAGVADVYPRTSPCYEWDLAAGDALVRAAGGSVTTLEGAPIRYNQWDSLKAPKFVAAGDAHIDYVGLIPDPDFN